MPIAKLLSIAAQPLAANSAIKLQPSKTLLGPWPLAPRKNGSTTATIPDDGGPPALGPCSRCGVLADARTGVAALARVLIGIRAEETGVTPEVTLADLGLRVVRGVSCSVDV